MPTSVGVISLDFVIKDKILPQIEKITAQAQSSAGKLGGAVSKAVEEPLNSIGKQAAETVQESVGKAGKKAAESVEQAMEQVKEVTDNGVEAALQRFVEREEAQAKSMTEAVKNASARISKSTGNYVQYNAAEITKTVETLSESIGKPLTQTVEKANAKLAEFGKFQINTSPAKRLRQEIEMTSQQMAILQKKWQELSAAEPSDKTTSQLAAVEQRILSTQKKLDGLNAKWSEMHTRSSTVLKKLGSGFGKVFGKIRSVGAKAFSSLGSKISGIGKSALSVIKPVNKLGTTLKNTFKRVFVMAGLYAAFRALKDGFIETAKADEQFSNSLNAVKANLAIAFTPIMQAVMPALNTLMSGLATVTKSIAGFISGIFGTTYKQAAEATKKLKSATEAAKKAKVSMAGIDEMNVLSGGGDDESGSSDSGIDYSKIDMTEPELPDWAERLKDSIKQGDWAGVGQILAERVNAVFSGINWEKLSSKINSGISKVTDGINGFVDNIDWSVMGDTVAGGLNTITSAINTFFDGIKWAKIGKGIADGLNRAIKKTDWKGLGKALSAQLKAFIDAGFAFVTNFDFKGLGKGIGEAVNAWFDNLDFGKAGATLSESFKGVLDTLIEIVQTIDWASIGAKIAEFIANIDWGGIASRLFELLGSAIGAAVSLLWGALQGVVDAIKEYFSGKIDEAGGNIVIGLFNGILDALKNVGTWIYEHIFKPFIDGFKKAFGIASPSKEMGTMGGFIIDGLFNAISDGIEKIREIFSKMLSAILEIFDDIDQWFSDKFRQAWEAIKRIFSGVGTWFRNRWNDITSAFSSVGTWFSNAFSGAWNGIKNAFSGVGKFFSGVWDGITSVFSHVTDWFRDKFSEAWQAVKNVFSAGGEIFSGIAENIAGIFKDVVNSLIDGINWVIAQPFNAINDALDGLRGLEIMDWEPFSWLPTIGVPEIPHLAKGGLATAPTLAMVGDNKNAATDPEVIAPLSKLKGMLDGDSGGSSEIVELLRIIIELLRSGMNVEIINYLFKNSKEFSREVLQIVNSDRTRRGE